MIKNSSSNTVDGAASIGYKEHVLCFTPANATATWMLTVTDTGIESCTYYLSLSLTPTWSRILGIVNAFIYTVITILVCLLVYIRYRAYSKPIYRRLKEENELVDLCHGEINLDKASASPESRNRRQDMQVVVVEQQTDDVNSENPVEPTPTGIQQARSGSARLDGTAAMVVERCSSNSELPFSVNSVFLETAI